MTSKPISPALSVVLSFRNEAAVLPELLRRLGDVLSSLTLQSEVVFVNDASDDGSLPLLVDAARRDRRLRIVTMSRRFGPAECALAGLAHARGEAVVLMDADLQDPPELIPTLIARWREGADVVYTVRTRRHGESWLKSVLTRAAYRLLRRVAGVDLPVDAGDFRLMNRRVVNEVLKLPEHTPYLRGLVAWVGFRQVAVPYERQPRGGGRTHFPVFSVNPWRTLLSGLTSFSSGPAVILLPAGLIFAGGAVAAAAVLLAVPAWRSALSVMTLLAVGVVFLFGIQMAALGLIGVYVARIYQDVRGRPRYIVDSVVGFDD